MLEKASFFQNMEVHLWYENDERNPMNVTLKYQLLLITIIVAKLWSMTNVKDETIFEKIFEISVPLPNYIHRIFKKKFKCKAKYFLHSLRQFFERIGPVNQYSQN